MPYGINEFIAYVICLSGNGGIMETTTVKGYPINLAGISGRFAVRQRENEAWVVDDVQTGFAVAHGPDRETAITNALKVAANKGEVGFQEAREQARRKIHESDAAVGLLAS